VLNAWFGFLNVAQPHKLGSVGSTLPHQNVKTKEKTWPVCSAGPSPKFLSNTGGKGAGQRAARFIT